MRERLIQGLAAAAIIGGLGYGAVKAVEAIDSSMTPTYETRGTPEPTPTETTVWQRPVDWQRRPTPQPIQLEPGTTVEFIIEKK